MQGGRRDANQSNGKILRVFWCHGKRPPGPVASASAAAAHPPTPARSTILGQSDATLATSAAESTSSALACAGFSRSVGDTAQRGLVMSMPLERPMGDTVAKISAARPQHMASESLSDRSIELRSLP